MTEKERKKKYIDIKNGASLYSMSQPTFIKIAKAADAVIKNKRVYLVDVERFEKYLECFHV